MTAYTIFRDPFMEKVVLQYAKGAYQRSLILGSEAWSGATLKGKAKAWGASYAGSRSALLKRLTAANIPWRFEVIDRRKTLVIGGDA